MGSSIQDYAKKINSRLTTLDCVSLLVTMVFLLAFLGFLTFERKQADIPVSYRVATSAESIPPSSASLPFSSKNGKTYTFLWCQGAQMILVKNRIYYATKEEAEQSGKVLSKLCQK